MAARIAYRGWIGEEMGFEAKLVETAQLVERRLEQHLSTLAGPPAVPERLAAALRHAVLGGGKRFRPFLVIESAGLFAVPEALALETAAAIELVHCYSLVHDDLPAMDNDRLRRGQPTVWAAYDEWTAILAGDALLTLAFELISGRDAHGDPAVRCELAAALARAAGGAGMVGGQALDLDADKRGEPAAPDIAHVRRLQAMKTGALIAFSCEAGAILGRASPGDREALRGYGGALGFAFQISDDLLDAEGDAAVVGKAVAKDAASGKATLVSLLGVAAARDRLDEVVEAGIAALSPFGDRARMLAQAIRFMARRQH